MKVALWAEIRRLAEIEKLSGRAISRRLHCSRHTVAAALELDQPPARAVPSRASLLDPHKAKIDALLAKYPELSAVRIREEIARGPDGYTGSVITVRRYLRTIRPARGRVYQEVHYEPAQAMQVDWGECGRVQVGTTTRKVSVFVAVLCYSRLMYIEFTLSQRKAEFYRGLVHALEFFGGSPRAIIFDNLKAAVLNGSGRVRLFPSRVPGAVRLLLLAADRLRTARSGIKRDRRGSVRYVKHNALAGRAEELIRFEDYLAFAPRVARPGGQRADARDDPRAAGGPLPARALAAARTAGDPLRHRRDRAGSRHSSCADRVRRQSLLGTAAPWHAGQSRFAPTVTKSACCTRARWWPSMSAATSDGQLIVLPDHRLAALALRRRSRSSALEQAFDALGPEARQFHLHLKSQPVKTGVHLRRLLGLARALRDGRAARRHLSGLGAGDLRRRLCREPLVGGTPATTASHAHSAHSQAARIDRRDRIGTRRSCHLRPFLQQHRGGLSWHDVMTISRHGSIVTWPS